MLRHLRATNFAILSDVEVDLGPGLNVLTGETGAGKSLIVEAVNLLRGGRASADIPRAGADEAVVEATVDIPPDLRDQVARVLDRAGLPPANNDEVLIRRIIARAKPAGSSNGHSASDGGKESDRAGKQSAGRGRCYVNGALTTAARLAELGALLIDLSGQHQHQGLVDPARHLEILDGYCRVGDVGGGATKGAGMDRSIDDRDPAARMAAAWAEYARHEDTVRSLSSDEQAREARVDYLRFQLDELDAAQLGPGEDTELEIERSRLVSVDLLQSSARTAEQRLYSADDCARDQIAAAARELERGARADPALETVAKQLAEIESLIDDAADQLRSYADKLEGDPERLAWVDERLAIVRRIVRKHGGSIEAALAKAAELRTELAALTSRDAALAEAIAARGAAEAAASSAAAALTKRRVKAARKLEKEVGAALVELGMAAAKVSVVVEPRALGPTGADRVELVLASNAGEPPQPLAKIASGGELSRIMLAIKLALRSADEVATYVFDEVDAGIGGATAQVVGAQIRMVANHRQVLCVTHLPQIAAYADHHFHVEKSEVAGRTETHVRLLMGAARKDELARMLGGSATSKAKAHAAELLALAARVEIRSDGPARRARV
jgi:DNA repair protein RecN (Recombination protein N)